MAKKKRKARKIKKVKKVKRVKLRTEAFGAKKTNLIKSAYTLSLAGGIIVLLGVLLGLFVGDKVLLRPENPDMHLIFGAVCGVVILIATSLIKKIPKTAAVLIGLFSIFAWIPYPYGLVFGPILSLIGSVIVLVKK